MRKIALGVCLAVAAAGCGNEAADDGDRLSGAEQLAACRAAQQGLDQFAREHPEVPIDELRRQADENCRKGFPRAPTPSVPRQFQASPGCRARSLEGGPLRRVPGVPKSGTPRVGGIRLPRGSRCPAHWASDAPVESPYRLAARLAAAFPKTGLWPLLWIGTDDPDAYVVTTGDVGKVDRLDAEEVLQRAWEEFAGNTPPFDEFPGLAPARRPSAPAAPFGILEDDPIDNGAGVELMWLVLVPVDRPADAMTVMGTFPTETLSDERISAVLRSWEDRFGAVLTALGPGEIAVSVPSPPEGTEQTLRIAAEHFALGQGNTAPAALPEYARGLEGATVWRLGWPD